MNKDEFKKIIADIDNSFVVSKDMIGARNVIWKLLPKELSDISKKFNTGGSLSNVEIQKIRSSWLSEDPLIDEDGNPFVFYIHDFRRSFWGKPSKVFHVSWCSTLEVMDKAGRKERYVKKTDLDNNKFRVDYGGNRKGFESLPACYNCQSKMRKVVAPRDLYYNRNNLDIIKFFKLYGKQDLINMNNSVYSVDYPENWAQISKKIKEERGGVCEKCGASSRLETHHKNGIPSDIRSENLIALCRDCHTKQFGHGHLKSSTDFNTSRSTTQSIQNISNGVISKSQMNKLENFIKQPERYATGTEKTAQKIRDAKKSFEIIKGGLSKEKQDKFFESLKIYENKLKNIR